MTDHHTVPPLRLCADEDQAFPAFVAWTQHAWFGHLGNHGMDQRAGDLFVMALGLGGETGEVLEAIADNDPKATAKELGDVCYYWGRLAQFYGLDPVKMLAMAKDVPVAGATSVPLRLAQWASRTQEVIKKAVRDDGLDRVSLERAMSHTLAYVRACTAQLDVEMPTILQGVADKILDRHATGQLRGSDTPNGRATKPR
jgi:hypothetical protein